MELNLGLLDFMPGQYAIIMQSTCMRRCTQSAFQACFKITLRLQEMQLLSALDRATPDSPQIELHGGSRWRCFFGIFGSISVVLTQFGHGQLDK